MNETTERTSHHTIGRSRPHLLAWLTVATVLTLVFAGCASSSSTTSKGTSASTTGTKNVSNDWALAYTGGTAGKADQSKSPVSSAT